MKVQTAREVLTQQEIEQMRVDNEQMLFDSFMYDGLINKDVIKIMNNVIGEDLLSELARKLATYEFERTLDLSVLDHIEYYGDNDTTVAKKLLIKEN